MDATEIKDPESLQAWLESLPQGTEDERETARRWAVTIAHRAAMRVLPLAWEWSTKHRDSKFRKLGFSAQRANLIAQVARFRGGESVLGCAIVASNAAYDAHAKCVDDNFPDISHADSIIAAGHAAYVAVYPSAESAFATYSAAYATSVPIMRSVRQDCISLQSASDLDMLRFWHVENELTSVWAHAKPRILAQGEGWRFWVEWYENALYGRPQDYDLLTKIALIDPADWDKGADHVNALIERIVEQHTLAKDARALKDEIAQLRQRLQSVEHRSHNNPPELVDETVAAQKEVTIIWAALDEAEQELEKPDPDPTVLERIGAFLKIASGTIAKYCGVLADLAVKTSVRTAAATGTAMALASQSEQLRAFGEALLQFARSQGAP